MAGFSLSSITSFFSNFANDRSGSVVGIDIGSSAIKVVQLRRDRGKAVLETYGAISLGPYGDVEVGRATALPVEAIVRALGDVLREANITAKDAALSIPYSASLVSVIRVPRVPEKQLGSMIPIEARKYIPVPISEVLLDWYAIPDSSKTVTDEKGQSTHMNVLLVAIHNDTIAKYQTIVKDAQLSASFFEIEVFSTVRSSLDHGIAPVAVLDMGASSTKLYLSERGIIRESHIVNKGGQDITLAIAQALAITPKQAEEEKRMRGLSDPSQENLVRSITLTLEPTLSEINRIILSYETHMQSSISKLILTGGGATLKGMEALLKTKLSTPIERAQPFAKTQAPAFLGDVLVEAGPEFSVAVGLALRRLQELS